MICQSENPKSKKINVYFCLSILVCFENYVKIYNLMTTY